jgi:hypothetical protein
LLRKAALSTDLDFVILIVGFLSLYEVRCISYVKLLRRRSTVEVTTGGRVLNARTE